MSSSTDWQALVNGALLMSFLTAAILAVPLLFLIRASVRRFMRRRVHDTVSVPPPPAVQRDAPPLHLMSAAAPADPLREEARPLAARMRRARRTAAALYCVAGVAAACVLANRLPLLPNYLWPVLLIVAAVGVPSFRARVTGLVVVFLTLLVAGQEAIAIYSFGPTLLLMFAANRWLKTISLVVALIALAAFGAMVGAMIVLEPFGKGGWLAAFVVLFALGLLAVHLVVRAYERKFFSDASLQFAFLWLMFVPWYAWLDRVWWRAFAALALYATITRLALLVLRRRARAHSPVSLLVLRVFGAPGRSRRLFEEVGTRWRYIGPIHLIAGADSATSNLDLSEAVRYLTFRFQSLYVTDHADLERRLAALDCAPDPDGCYRVNDFFCFDDTWQRTFTELLRRSDAVLVDLSGYGPQNAGVAFELGHLLGSRPLDSFVLVTDGKNDVDHLGLTLTRLWRQLDPSLTNARLEHPALRVLHTPKPSRLVAALCDAAVASSRRDA